MSSPTSLKMNHPLFIDRNIRNKHMIGYIIHMWFSFIPMIFFELGYTKLYSIMPVWIPIILIPLNVILAYYILVGTAIFIMKIRLSYLKLKHKPREGIFPRDPKNKDYKYHSLRNFVYLFPSYLIASVPFPWFRRSLYMLAFGIKVGKGGVSHNVWITPEFVEIGNNVQIGFASSIISSFVENDKLIIKKIKIEDNVILGVKTTILPGAIIKKNTIIGAGSYLLPFQICEENSEYFGRPAELIKKIDKIDFSKV